MAKLGIDDFFNKYVAPAGRFLNNSTGEISEEDLREFAEDLKDSFRHVDDFSGIVKTVATLDISAVTDTLNLTSVAGADIINLSNASQDLEITTIVGGTENKEYELRILNSRKITFLHGVSINTEGQIPALISGVSKDFIRIEKTGTLYRQTGIGTFSPVENPNFVRSVNGATPDGQGNVEIVVPPGGGNSITGSESIKLSTIGNEETGFYEKIELEPEVTKVGDQVNATQSFIMQTLDAVKTFAMQVTSSFIQFVGQNASSLMTVLILETKAHFTLKRKSDDKQSELVFDKDGLYIAGDHPDLKGIYGDKDYSSAAGDFGFVQKKWVQDQQISSSRPASTQFLLDNVFGVYYGDYTQTGNVTFTLAPTGHKIGGAAKFVFLSDGIHTVGVSSSFNFIYGIATGGTTILPAGQYEVFAIYNPDGKASIIFPGSAIVNPPIVNDNAAPLFVSGTPSIVSLTNTGFQLNAALNEPGKAYFVLLANGSTAPSIPQIKSGLDSTDTAAFKAGAINVLAANTIYSSIVSGLSENTEYDLYIFAEDNTPNLQISYVKLDITTILGVTVLYSQPFNGSTLSPDFTVVDPVDTVGITQNNALIFTRTTGTAVTDVNANTVTKTTGFTENIVTMAFDLTRTGDLTAAMGCSLMVDLNNRVILTRAATAAKARVLVFQGGSAIYDSGTTSVDLSGKRWKIVINRTASTASVFYWDTANGVWAQLGSTVSVTLSGTLYPNFYSANSPAGAATMSIDNLTVTNNDYSVQNP